MSGRSVIAAVQFNVDPGGERLARQDIDLAARAFSKLDDSRVCVLIAYLNDEENQETAVRVAVHVAGSTAMTAELDADLVPDRVLDSLAELKKLLGNSAPRTASSLAGTVAVKKIREEFYKAVAKWAEDKQDSLPKDSKGGEAVLRHLIRVVFAWILKENKLCNPDIFEEWFAKWLEAHTEKQKANVQTKDRQARDTLKAKLEEASWDRKLYPEIWNFAEHKIFDTDAGISKADARLVFYRQGLAGFDIVIGNPPYVKAAKPQKKELEKKSYITGEGGDLYNFCCETALTLAKPQGGVVCLVVPHSLSFAKAQTTTRQLFETASSEIWLRHQDNRPDQTFGESPVESSENRQRTTIITALTGDALPEIWTSGMARWASAEREAYFKSRRFILTPETFSGNNAKDLIKGLACQWPRLPSEKISYLVAEMRQQKTIFKDLPTQVAKWKIGFPKTAYNFISILPAAKLNRIEKLVSVDNYHSRWLAMAVFNNHLFYAWWRIWSDAFNLTKYQIESMPIPDAWLEDSKINSKAINIGKQFEKLLEYPENITKSISGTKGKTVYNINFHEVAPELVEQADRLYLKALKIESAEADLMLDELRKLRSESNWRR